MGNWGESLPSLQRCNFVCLSVCLYVPVCHMDWHDNLLLGLMILYQLLRELLRMGNLQQIQSSFARPKHALHAPSSYVVVCTESCT